jgi:hypothetical protein
MMPALHQMLQVRLGGTVLIIMYCSHLFLSIISAIQILIVKFIKYNLRLSQTICLYVYDLHTKLHMPSSSGLLVIAVKLKAKYNRIYSSSHCFIFCKKFP